MRVSRLVTGLVAMMTITLLLTACGNDTADGNDSTPTTAPGETPTPTTPGNGREELSGGELTVQYIEFMSFDPHFSAFAQDIGHQGMVWRGLYDIGTDNRPYPLLAVGEPHIAPDGRTYTVSLREDLLWSDGEPLTAHDFVAAVHRTCSFNVAGQYQYLLSNIQGCDDYYAPGNADLSTEEQEALREAIGVDAVDDHTISFDLVNPQPTFTLILSLWVTWPVPTHIVEHPGDDWPDPAALAFNGPFAVDSYQPGEHMVLVRNDNFAGNVALLDRLTLRYVADDETANNAFRSRELDVTRANVANLASLEQEFDDELVSTVTASTVGLMINVAQEPLDQLEVRRALAMAIDRQTLIDVVLQGAHVPTTDWMPSEILGADAGGFDDVIGYNPEGARELMEQAGYPGGEGFPEINIVVADIPEPRTVAEFLQQQYLEILGIDVSVDVVDPQGRGQRLVTGDYYLFPGGFQQDYPDPENWLVGLFHSQGSMNYFGCEDPEIDALIDEARYNTDDAERRELYRQANELVVSRVCGIIPYQHNANHYLVSPTVGGARDFTDTKDRILPGDWAAEEWHVVQ